MSTGWAQRGKAAIAGTKTNVGGQGQVRGERHLGVVEGIELKTFSTGSNGAVISYTVAGYKFPVREYLVFAKADGTALFGRGKLSKRLMSMGLSSAQINKLPTEGGALQKALEPIKGVDIGLFIGKEEKIGNDGTVKSYPKVTGTFAVDPGETPNAA